MNRVKEVERINRADLRTQLRSDTTGNAGSWDVSKSWHAQYKDSAYVYVGGLPYGLSEGDIIVIFSQFGEIVDVNLPRDKDTGKPKGFAFIAYEDQRSTVLAVDNFNGAKVLGRTLRCDHCASFHEEQKKDADKLPEHLLKKLSDKELEEKKAEIARRNEELDEAATAKADLFALGRGTAESEDQQEERQIRQSIADRREAEATAKRTAHIDAVLARRRAEHARVASDEARVQEEREQRRKQREEEKRLAALQVAPAEAAAAAAAATAAAAAAAAVDESGGAPAVSASRWERLMGGGGGKKKKKKRDREGGDERSTSSRREERDAPGERRPGDGISVGETNELRASLGLKPLRS